MTKKIKATMIQIGVGIIIGLILGILSGTILEENLFEMKTMLYFMVMFLVSFLLHIVIHEGGHFLIGYFFGFEFVSFRIGSYMWVNDNGKIHFKRYHLAGTGGQCLMNPPLPQLKGYLLYLLGGGVCNLVVALVCLLLCFVTSDLLFNIFCFSNVAVGLLIGLLNLIPMDLGIPNDGYNAYCLVKEPSSIHSLYRQLVIAKELADGKKLEEMDGSLFDSYDGADVLNPLNTCIEVNCGERMIHQGRWVEAKETFEYLFEQNITEVYKNEIIYQLVLLEILLNEHPDVDQFLTKKMKKKMSADKTNISSLLAQYGIELVVNKNEEQAMIALKYLNDVYKTYPYRGELESIKELQRKVEERVNLND